MGKALLNGDKTGPIPTERGKHGVKLSMFTDGRGVPLGGGVAGVNVNDHLLIRETLNAVPVTRPKPTPRAPRHLCLDKGYDYDVPRTLTEKHSFILHLRTRGEEIQAKRHRGAKARRWVVYSRALGY